MEDFDSNHDGKVSREEFKAALSRMRTQLSSKDDAAKEYTSFNKMNDHRYKHVRMGRGLEDKYKVPLTFT